VNIAFVNATTRWGGVKTWSLDMGRAAMDAGHKSVIYGKDPRFMEKARAQGMHARQVAFAMDFNPRAIALFYNEFRKHGISHLVVNVGKDLRTAGVAARLCRIPVVVHVGAPQDFSDSALRRWTHWFIRPAYICCSAFVAAGIVRHAPFLDKARVGFVHPGVAMPAEPPCLSRPPYTLVTSSRLTSGKRHADLLLACALLRQEGVPFFLRIVGEGPEEENLRRLAREHRLEDAVTFVGFTRQVDQELRKGDIFVLPTNAEPLGIALEEAMAQGLFPVARQAGGVPEIWPEQFSSSLLPAQAGPREFADCLRSLLSTPPPVLDGWRRAVQAHARSAFNLERQFRVFAAFLQEV
jgi:glycosyltransferase involved in cell wall biosynthesis